MSKKREVEFAIPGQKEASEQQEESSLFVQQDSQETKMNLLWLLQHFSKENLAAYKAQKERKKIEKTKKKGKPTFSVPTEQSFVQLSPKIPMEAVEKSQEEKPILEDVDDDFGETVFIDRGHRPGIAVSLKASLECLGFDKIVPLDKTPFVIGRSIQGVDLCVMDNKTVGRMHAQISFHAGSYYITDLNSRNRVYLDGKQIPQGNEIQLKNLTKITLGDEEFIFHIDNR